MGIPGLTLFFVAAIISADRSRIEAQTIGARQPDRISVLDSSNRSCVILVKFVI